MTEVAPTYIQAYETAKAFWRDWHRDSDADMKYIERDPRKVIGAVLVERYDQHPRQAAFTSRMANESVLEHLEIEGRI
ncbi:MAG TPA: hypothetical protein VK978_00675 [Candidatus Saccharimonadales bacterium]|nr:hypothetical protein [Candidatus Saccharimonadales bacterium]